MTICSFFFFLCTGGAEVRVASRMSNIYIYKNSNRYCHPPGIGRDSSKGANISNAAICLAARTEHEPVVTALHNPQRYCRLHTAGGVLQRLQAWTSVGGRTG